MTNVTKFSSRDPGPQARVVGFFSHLREHGFRLGVQETKTALLALVHVNAVCPVQTKRALRAICTGCREDSERFGDLFDSYWLNGIGIRNKIIPSPTVGFEKNLPLFGKYQTSEYDNIGNSDTGEQQSPDNNLDGESLSDGLGKLIATREKNLSKKDLREIIEPEEIVEAEKTAFEFGLALRDRRSRRSIASSKGRNLNLRKIMRDSLGTGGVPIRLSKKTRPERLCRITAICDVSGSMTVYSRIFLAFLAGLIRVDSTADAYLFHTRLVRITETLREKDTMRALTRMSLMADGFGGGTKIGKSIGQFVDGYAKRFVNGRSVVLILSDGYDTDTPEVLSASLRRLKKRGCRVIWLNPLKGWQDYEPIASGMSAALPYLDLFSAANTLGDIENLKTELARL